MTGTWQNVMSMTTPRRIPLSCLAAAAFLLTAAGTAAADPPDDTTEPAPDVSICQVGVPGPCNGDGASPLHRLVDTAAQRLATADPVAAFKWINGGDITDPARVDQVLATVSADATARGVDAAFVRTVFTDQIDATEGVQYTRFGQWNLDPATAPAAAPDLSQSRTLIDGYNAAMVEEIALQWNTLNGANCAEALSTATADVVAQQELDGLYQQALGSATRSYCQPA